MWMSAGLFSILVIATAAAQSCPANQINSDAQIVTHGEGIIPAVPITAVPSVIRNPALIDPNLTFFSEVLGYSDDQIQQEVQNALQFLSERFGLDFSLSQPNELGVRFFQNATLQPVRRVLDVVAILNRWLLTGNTRSKCFLIALGGFRIAFSGEQLLRGTYGGAEGIYVPNERCLNYIYLSITVSPPCEPIVIRRTTPRPIQDQLIGDEQTLPIFFELSHRTLGQGSEEGLIQFQRFTAANGTAFFRWTGGTLLTFPPNVLTFN